MNFVGEIGSRTVGTLITFGDFCRFVGKTFYWVASAGTGKRSIRLMLRQMYEVGARSVPVVMITGAFVGMVLAAQSVLQFKAVGLEADLGSIVNLSVVRELGPVLAAIVLAGRVGGALAAELGTMRVTEQMDALRAMGADPIRVLVMPRFLACLLLMPFLVLYADLTGILGGYVISVRVYEVNASAFWDHAAKSVEMFDIVTGLIKGTVFVGAMSLISCYHGFRCKPGAAGVGQACTQSFVESCMSILALDFFLGVFFNAFYVWMWGSPPTTI